MKNYKTLLVSGLFTVIFLASSKPTFACTPHHKCNENVPTVITGSVKNQQNHFVNGAAVTIVCIHNGASNTKTTTTHNGFYSVSYRYDKCDETDQVTVTATKDGQTGINTGTVKELRCLMDIAIINIIMVPEFGLISGALAVAGSVGGYLKLKRKIN
jgi:hypothetical protein